MIRVCSINSEETQGPAHRGVMSRRTRASARFSQICSPESLNPPSIFLSLPLPPSLLYLQPGRTHTHIAIYIYINIPPPWNLCYWSKNNRPRVTFDPRTLHISRLRITLAMRNWKVMCVSRKNNENTLDFHEIQYFRSGNCPISIIHQIYTVKLWQSDVFVITREKLCPRNSQVATLESSVAHQADIALRTEHYSHTERIKIGMIVTARKMILNFVQFFLGRAQIFFQEK